MSWPLRHQPGWRRGEIRGNISFHSLFTPTLYRDTWKWVNKAVQKLIRYDLREGSTVSIVSFSNVTRIEARMEAVSGESRERIADTVPGKDTYRGCLNCF